MKAILGLGELILLLVWAIIGWGKYFILAIISLLWFVLLLVVAAYETGRDNG